MQSLQSRLSGSSQHVRCSSTHHPAAAAAAAAGGRRCLVAAAAAGNRSETANNNNSNSSSSGTLDDSEWGVLPAAPSSNSSRRAPDSKPSRGGGNSSSSSRPGASSGGWYGDVDTTRPRTPRAPPPRTAAPSDSDQRRGVAAAGGGASDRPAWARERSGSSSRGGSSSSRGGGSSSSRQPRDLADGEDGSSKWSYSSSGGGDGSSSWGAAGNGRFAREGRGRPGSSSSSSSGGGDGGSRWDRSPGRDVDGPRSSNSSGRYDNSSRSNQYGSSSRDLRSWDSGREPGSSSSSWNYGSGGSSSNSGPNRWGSSSGSGAAVKKKQKEKKAASLAPSNQPCCYGCGAPLQTTVSTAAGFVSPDKYQIKQKHKQLNKVLCARCSGLCNGAMIPAVQDFTQRAWVQQQAALLQQQQQVVEAPVQPDLDVAGAGTGGVAATATAGDDDDDDDDVDGSQLELLGKLLVTPEQLRQKITEVRSVKALVVLLVDLLDASGTLMSKVRDMVGNNPIVLVGTKMDLLPPDCKPKEVADWLAEAAARRRLLVTSSHLVSSHTGEGIAAVTGKVCRERKGRDVFVVGAANVGKSAFVRAMLKEMSSLTGGNFDAAAMSMSRYLPVESAMPGTTLGLIPLQAFETGGTLYDTPGVHLHHRIPHMLTPEELRLLHPRKRLTAFTSPAPLEILRAHDDEEGEESQPEYGRSAGLPGSAGSPSDSGHSALQRSKPKEVSASYFWSELVRVDVLSGPPSCSLVFYGPKTLRVYALPLLEEGQEVELDLEEEDQADGSGSDDDDSSSSSRKVSKLLLCRESVEARGGLVPHTLVVKSPIPTSTCLADVAVSGLPGWIGVFAPFSKQDIVLRVWAPRGVEVFLRPPLPCPPPPKPQGSEEPEELVEVGEVLARAEEDQEWEAHRASLGLGPMSAEDEEVVRLLLFGNEEAGLAGIVDIEEEEGEGAPQEDEETTELVLRAEQLVARAADAAGRRRVAGSSSSSNTSSSVGRARRRGRAAAASLENENDDIELATAGEDEVVEEFGGSSEGAAGLGLGEGWGELPTLTTVAADSVGDGGEPKSDGRPAASRLRSRRRISASDRGR